MKVFYILSNPIVGGVEGMLSEIIPRFDKEKFSMGIVNMHSSSDTYNLWETKNLKYFKFRTPSKLLMESVFPLSRLLNKEKPNIVHIFGLRANIIGRLAAKLAGISVILTGVVSTDDWRKWYHVFLDRSTGWIVDGFIANARACKDSLVLREKYNPSRIDIIFDGINEQYWHRGKSTNSNNVLRQSLGYTDEHNVFVTVANLRPDKGIKYLLEAVPAVLKIEPMARFLLVGKDLMNGVLQNKCVQLGIIDQVQFLGFRHDLKDIYQAVDATVLPSLREGLPICLIEAMSMELPVIATNVSGIPELVINGQSGLLVPPKDTPALSRAILKIAHDKNKRRLMGMKGRKIIVEKFTIDTTVSQLMNYYNKISNTGE